MELSVHGVANPAPFLSARDLFETEYDLDLPAHVNVRTNPDERTWVAHYGDRHVLNVSRQTASSALARELALHEFSHMHRFEEGHASHRQSTREALYLALTEPGVDRRLSAHGVQIANHMKDIYADDLTLSVAPSDKLVAFLESGLATALMDHDSTSTAAITAVNAAFALALCERHDLLGSDHRLYDLAEVASADAPGVPVDEFKERFRGLSPDPSPSEYRRELVGVIRSYARTRQAAD